MVRSTATLVGVVLLILGVVGFFINEPYLLGQVNVTDPENVIHLVLGAVFVLAGISPPSTTRLLLLIVGIGTLVVGVIGFFVSNAFGLLPNFFGNPIADNDLNTADGGWTIVDNIIHLAIGGLALATATLPGRAETTTTSTTAYVDRDRQ